MPLTPEAASARSRKAWKKRRRSPDERFWERVDKHRDGCWIWTAGKLHDGYGAFYDGRSVRAHRWAYERLVGPIPEGMVTDHLCRNRACVNPDHLELVSNGENVLRGQGAPAQNARKTHCVHGHPLSGENLRRRKDGGRYCPVCASSAAKDRRASRSVVQDDER